MSQLKENLEKILEEKELKIISENIKSGIQIFGVNGKNTIVDTEDANAQANNLLQGKTAYVNGQKIEGTLNPDDGIYHLIDGILYNDFLEGRKVVITNYFGSLEFTFGHLCYTIGYMDNKEAQFSISKMTNIDYTGKLKNGTIKVTYYDKNSSELYSVNFDIPNIPEQGLTQSIALVSVQDDDNTFGENLVKNAVYFTVDFEEFEKEMSGIDTTDATATEDKILEGYTAYANGEKIEGTIEIINYDYPTSKDQITTNDEFPGVLFLTNVKDKYFNDNSTVIVPEDILSEHYEVTPDKILEGETIMGVQGSVKPYVDPETTDDYLECLKLSNKILTGNEN